MESGRSGLSVIVWSVDSSSFEILFAPKKPTFHGLVWRERVFFVGHRLLESGRSGFSVIVSSVDSSSFEFILAQKKPTFPGLV